MPVGSRPFDASAMRSLVRRNNYDSKEPETKIWGNARLDAVKALHGPLMGIARLEKMSIWLKTRHVKISSRCNK